MTPELLARIARLESELDAVLTRLDELSRSYTPAGRLASTLVERVIQTVSAHYLVPRRVLMSRSRSASIVWPRQVAIYLLRMHYGMSYPECARAFRRTAGAAMHAVQAVRDRAETQRKVADQIADMLRHLDPDTHHHAHTIPNNPPQARPG